MKIQRNTFLLVLAGLGAALALNHLLGAIAGIQYISFFARYASADGVVTCTECALWTLDQPFLFMILFWVILYLALPKVSAFRFDLLRFRQLNFEIRSIWASFIVLAALWFFCKFLNLYPALYREDHLLENLTALFFFLATGLLLIKSIKPGMYNRWWLLFIALLFFVIAMEEISWGQRIFGWTTPESFSEFNYQNETNLHNVLNPFMTPLYVIANFMIGLFLLYIKEVRIALAKTRWLAWLLPIFPTSIYEQTGLLFLFLSLQRFWFGDELTEQFVSFYILIYTLDIYLDKYITQEIAQPRLSNQPNPIA